MAVTGTLNSLEGRGWQKSTIGRRKLVGLVARSQIGADCFVIYHYCLAVICRCVACTQHLLVVLSAILRRIFITNGHQQLEAGRLPDQFFSRFTRS